MFPTLALITPVVVAWVSSRLQQSGVSLTWAENWSSGPGLSQGEARGEQSLMGLLFQDVLLRPLQGAVTSLQSVVHLQSQACPLLLSHQVKARDSVKRIKFCVVLRNSQ